MTYLNVDCYSQMNSDLINNSVDLIITSPPDMFEVGLYGKEYIDFISKIFKELDRVTIDSGFICIINTDRKYNSFVEPKHILFHDILRDLGWKIKDYKILVKNSTDLVDLYRLTYNHVIIYTKKGTIPKKTPDYRKDVWVIKQPKNHDQFSDVLVTRLIENLSKPSDTVLDPFAGRGTTPYTAQILGRFGIGYEIVTEIYNEGVKWMADTLKKNH